MTSDRPPYSPEEAAEVLRQVEGARQQARRPLRAFVGQLLALWGLIYLVMYGVSALGLADPRWSWFPVVSFGFAASFVLGARVGSAIRSPEGRALRQTWTWFGVVMATASFALVSQGAEDPLFSFVINLLVAFALLQSGELLSERGLVRAGLLLAAANALFLAAGAQTYALALAALGLVALVTGVLMTRRYAVR
ncbi:hypothetical protein [Oceanithermus sp.]